MSYQKFVITFVIVLAGFVAANLLIWNAWSEDLLAGKTGCGDMARLSYLPAFMQLRQRTTDLPRRHLEVDDFTSGQVDLITLGDSFTNGGGGGLNRYYQDYIASQHQLTVLNLEPYQEIGYIPQILSYLHSGYFEQIGLRYLLVSAAERSSVEHFSGTVDPSATLSLAELQRKKKFGYQNKPDPVPMINMGNMKLVINNIRFYGFNATKFSDIYLGQLSQPLFSNKMADKLLFFRDDAKNVSHGTKDNVQRVNDNMNRLADMLAAKGIRLYFMPCVNKYNLYSEFLVENPFPKSSFFEELRALPKRYTFIDTKAILSAELRRGEKDIFYVDDTHWSWKASKAIFTQQVFR